MGSGSSVPSSPLSSTSSSEELIQIIPDIYHCKEVDDNIEIDINALILSLRKLSCIFMKKKHLNQNFIDTVLSSNYQNFDNQFVSVALWIAKHDRTALVTPYELYSLIKYIELHRPIDAMKTSKVESSGVSAEELRLSYPRRDSIPSFTGHIRAKEANMLSLGKSARFLPVDNTVRVRTHSVDDLSSVDLDEYFEI